MNVFSVVVVKVTCLLVIHLVLPSKVALMMIVAETDLTIVTVIEVTTVIAIMNATGEGPM